MESEFAATDDEVGGPRGDGQHEPAPAVAIETRGARELPMAAARVGDARRQPMTIDMRRIHPLRHLPIPTVALACAAFATADPTPGGSCRNGDRPADTTELQADLSLRLESTSARAGFDLREISRLAREKHAATGTSAATAPALAGPTSFAAWLDAVVAYMEARMIVIEDQARELGHVQFPEIDLAELARTQAYAVAGDAYAIDISSMHGALEDDGSCVLALTNGGGAADLNGLERLPFSVPAVNLSMEPDWVAAAVAPYNAPILDGFFYSAVLGDGLAHAGTAFELTSAGQDLLILHPDTVVPAGAWIDADSVVILRYLDRTPGGVDWTAVLHALRPELDLPVWTPEPGSDGSARLQSSCDNVLECLLAAQAAYNAGVTAAAHAYGDWVDQAQQDYEYDRRVISESRWGMARIFSNSLFMGTVGGAGPGAWYDYYKGFDQQNKAQLDKELADAKTWLKNELCRLAGELRNDVLECIEDCPEWAWLADFMDTWVAAQGC
jgi:hypothetical protein